MVKHNIASSESAELSCQKIAASAEKLRHRKVTRSINLDVVLWIELKYIALDSGYGTIEIFLKEMALDSLGAVEEARTGNYALTRN
ncbi:MAG: hypothetical protein EAZ73_08990 [Oscillatoriales cyanobacterium]|uniref:hypothetical protein n=1 Tax=unclassified Microcoleus TaxID=2642155 RepID=UPI001D4CE73A|nr:MULTISPECIES: hypothetical protein [unclassified Microcoleus]TAF00887.1 MAG: hypothetical protein EAZ79_01610 [Oscillatoriales cyanobacterium]MCC3459772.1 hypothetical protein [Microcoleus sp. PH2017_11_PCY_U_A]MCC3478205.1 hypothetical protein [Microcoleus sp. PH2017_12_PCY_D_A]TAF21355.1 MAG: hypothetical protein EAZ73_08990 [Oscillatoriales cyanobacterium]TAF39718.1 MAG: hypothetical protein EAZ69_00355 [Oscillatoriales cyanobacterium]